MERGGALGELGAGATDKVTGERGLSGVLERDIAEKSRMFC
jgi:hypothetical protein